MVSLHRMQRVSLIKIQVDFWHVLPLFAFSHNSFTGKKQILAKQLYNRTYTPLQPIILWHIYIVLIQDLSKEYDYTIEGRCVCVCCWKSVTPSISWPNILSCPFWSCRRWTWPAQAVVISWPVYSVWRHSVLWNVAGVGIHAPVKKNARQYGTRRGAPLSSLLYVCKLFLSIGDWLIGNEHGD